MDIVLNLYYDPEENIFRNENGRPIFDIFKYVSTNELLVFKGGYENMYIIRYKAPYHAIRLLHPDPIYFGEGESCYDLETDIFHTTFSY